MRATSWMVALSAAWIAACQVTPDGGGAREGATSMSAKAEIAALEAANWDHAIDVRIELRDYGLTPGELRLKRGQPYRLTVFNSGGHAHYFDAPEFLNTVATRYVTVRDQVEIKAPHFSSFEVARRGGEFSIEFVPLVKGDYLARCHFEGDVHQGVRGRIIVE